MRTLDNRLSLIEKITSQKLAIIQKRKIDFLNASLTSEENARLRHVYADLEASQKEPINLNTLIMDWVIDVKWAKAYEAVGAPIPQDVKTHYTEIETELGLPAVAPNALVSARSQRIVDYLNSLDIDREAPLEFSE